MSVSGVRMVTTHGAGMMGRQSLGRVQVVVRVQFSGFISGTIEFAVIDSQPWQLLMPIAGCSSC